MSLRASRCFLLCLGLLLTGRLWAAAGAGSPVDLGTGGAMQAGPSLSLPGMSRPEQPEKYRLDCSLADQTLCYGDAPEEEPTSEPEDSEQEKEIVADDTETEKTRSDSQSKSGGKNKSKPEEEEEELISPARKARCESDYASYQVSCAHTVAMAETRCESKNSPEIAVASQYASRSAQEISQKSTESILAACAKMEKVSGEAANAVTSYRLRCSTSITECRSQCGGFVNFVKSNADCFVGQGDRSSITSMSLSEAQANAISRAGQCQTQVAKVTDATKAIATYQESGTKARHCAGDTAGGSSHNIEGKHNPQMADAGGAIDCFNPVHAATNPACVCSSYPHDPICSGDASVTANTMESWSRAASSREVAAESRADAGPTHEAASGMSGLGAGSGVARSPAETVAEGKQGGFAPGSSSVRARPAPAVRAHETHAADTVISSGDWGVQGGAGSGASAPPASDTSDKSVSVKGAAKKSAAAAHDLRRFLPGGTHAAGVNGVSGPDGITGPHSDIWRKIQNRYRSHMPSFLP